MFDHMQNSYRQLGTDLEMVPKWSKNLYSLFSCTILGIAWSFTCNWNSYMHAQSKEHELNLHMRLACEYLHRQVSCVAWCNCCHVFCTLAQSCLDRVLCSIELIIDWIVVPCSVSIVSWTSQLIPLPRDISYNIAPLNQAFQVVSR